MTTTLVVVAVLAALACPLHMIWQRRRGRTASCVASRGDAEGIEARQRHLAARIEELSRSGGDRA